MYGFTSFLHSFSLCYLYFSRLFFHTVTYCCGCCLVTKLCLALCDPMTAACQAPLSMGLPGKSTGLGRHVLPGDLLDLCFLHLQVDSLPLNHPESLELSIFLSKYHCYIWFLCSPPLTLLCFNHRSIVVCS